MLELPKIELKLTELVVRKYNTGYGWDQGIVNNVCFFATAFKQSVGSAGLKEYTQLTPGLKETIGRMDSRYGTKHDVELLSHYAPKYGLKVVVK